jgi:CHASE3 domain sensor protein
MPVPISRRAIRAFSVAFLILFMTVAASAQSIAELKEPVRR